VREETFEETNFVDILLLALHQATKRVTCKKVNVGSVHLPLFSFISTETFARSMQNPVVVASVHYGVYA